MAGLSADRIFAYMEDGYLQLEVVLSTANLQPLIDDINTGIDRRAREAFSEGRSNTLFENEPFDRRLAGIYETMEDSSEVEKAVTGKRLKTAGMFALITHRAILDIVELVMGTEILAHPQFNSQAKIPNKTQSKIPWHQDLSFLHPDAEGAFVVNF